MKKFFLLTNITYLILISILSCQNPKPQPNEIIARVGNAYLTRDVLLGLVPANLQEAERDYYLKKIVDQWVEEQTLYQAARKEGIELMPHEQWQVEKLERELLAEKFISQKIKGEFPITDQEIEDFYQNNQELFKRDFNEVHIVHLFLEQLDRAIVKEIRGTKSLLEVIQKNYLDRQITPVLEPNGDLGYVVYDDLRPELRRAIRGTKTGRIYGPIRTREGYHYLQVLDRQPAGSVRSLDLVREEIITHLKVEKRQQAIHDLKEKLKREFQIETFLNNLP